MIKSAVRLLS